MKRVIILTLLLGLASVQAQEQHVNSKEAQALRRDKTIYGQYIDTLVVRALAENSSKFYNAPGVPQFAVVGRDRKFYFGVGGYIKGTMSYDFGNPIANPVSFDPAAIPMNLAKGNEGLVQFGVGSSSLNFNFVGMPGTKDAIGAYFNIVFANPNNGFYLLNAYGTYRGFKVGYDFSLFTDLGAGPPTIDFAGPNAWTIIPNALVDYEYQWGKHWGVGVGLEMPIASYTNGAYTYTVNQRIPDIPFYLQYSWQNRSSWIRLSGLVRNMSYYDLKANQTNTNTGMGGKISGTALLVKNLTAYYQGVYGKGITSYFEDTYGASLDMLPSKCIDGKLDNVTSWGGYFGLQYNFSPTTFMTATYSTVRTEAPESIYPPTLYRNGSYIVTNLFWNVAPSVQMGAEYIWGERVNANGDARHNSRIQMMLQVNF